MWGVALGLFLGCKWLTLRRATTRLAAGPALTYLFLWTGMDPDEFLAGGPATRPHWREWLEAGAKAGAGAAILGLATRLPPGTGPLTTGWIGMVGVVLLLHFGICHLVSLGWRTVGRPAPPLMRAPLRSKSLAEFWGRRWNTAFSSVANEFVFHKLARPLGANPATLAVFLVSGLVHDLLISFPARAGYGLPTAYFLVQGAGLLFERSQAGRWLGLGRGLRGRLFACLLTAAPAFWLFHPAFVNRVILPMLQALGATPPVP
jgi:alginate O-acetyltransferase complex protein AlgI